MRLPLMATCVEGLGQGRGGAGGDGVLAGQVDAEGGDMGAEVGDGFERRDADEI